MRFYIWNKNAEFDLDSNATATVTGTGFKRDLLSYGAEVVDPLIGQVSEAYNSSLKTEIIIHGFNSGPPYGGISDLIQAHQQKGDYDEFNFIALDWRYVAKMQLPGNGYDAPADWTELAGVRAGKMLNAMMENGTLTNFDDVHIIGHSLGAHVAGTMARTLFNLTGRNVTHITALDPAGPKFVDDQDTPIALKITDALYIDAVHTDGGLARPFVLQAHMGNARDDMAHANFYMNGGQTQPDCPPTFGMCSHQRAFHYYGAAALFPTGFLGKRCKLVPGTKRNGALDWRQHGGLVDKGCLTMNVSDHTETAYLTDVYDIRARPMGDYVIRTTGEPPYIDATWVLDQAPGVPRVTSDAPPNAH